MTNSTFFIDCNSWGDFQIKLNSLNKKEKGDAFELLTKLYFKINPVFSFYDEVWMLSEVPQKTLEYLKIPSHDLGIDLIAKSGGEYHAIQCKFHSEIDSSVSFKEVSTFISLLEGNKNFTQGYICSSANITSRNFEKIETKPITTILADTWQNLDKDFFDKARHFLNKEKFAPIAYKPKEHQKKALKQALNYFIKENNSRGKLIFPCGAGKSLTGYWLTQELKSKATIIAVPSLSLVKQTLDVYLREIVAKGKKVKWLCICSDEGIGSEEDIVFKTENLGVPCQTDPIYIENWLLENKNENIVIFTTYQSGRIIAEISKNLNFTFNVGIFDEAHKTVGSGKKLFSHLLFEENISIEKRIFMTATERFYAGSKDDIISMDDTDIYGDTFAQMSFKEAIEMELLTDYKVITIDVKKSEIAEFIKDNNLVQLNDKWKKETEARSLASMLALRKAMKLFPIKNAVSFHSSIDKAVRNKELQTYITTLQLTLLQFQGKCQPQKETSL
jgi:predicted helicase